MGGRLTPRAADIAPLHSATRLMPAVGCHTTNTFQLSQAIIQQAHLEKLHERR